MSIKTLIGAALMTSVAFVAGTASATVYRAGLAGGYLNAYNGDNYHTVTVPDIGYFPGPEAGWSYGSNGSKTTYPPVWADNRTWCYHGQMYFDGGSYWFVEAIDDAAYVAVDGVQVLMDKNWSGNGISSEVAPSTGWHEVEFRFGNGGSGAGVFDQKSDKGNEKWLQSHDKDENLCGIGYATGIKPTMMKDCAMAKDPGDGSLFRIVDESANYIVLNSIAKVDGGYSFNITSLSANAAEVAVFMGSSPDGGENPAAWSVTSGDIAFDANATKDVTVEYAGESVPYFIIRLESTGATLAEGEGVPFWQWSDVGKCTMEPTVSPVIGEVTPQNASFAVTLGYKTTIVGMDPPTMALKAYYGETDAGAGGAWDFSVDFGDANAAGSYDCELKNLEEGKTYYVRFAAKTEESDWIWSECLAFSTSGPSLEAPVSVCENDPTEQSFKVMRPVASSAEPLTVYLSYSGATDKVSALPPSVTFEAGVSEVRVPFTMIDDALSSGDATLTLTITENAAYVRGEPYTVDITILDDEASAGEIVWTGAAGDDRWETAGNWSPARIPTAMDTAVFTDSGLASGGKVTNSTDVVCRILKISRLAPMTLGGTGSLKLGGIIREDVEGTEADQTISVPLKLYPTDGDNCVWNVNGAGQLILAAASQKAVTTVYLYKTGAGKLRLSAANAAPGGILKVFEGDAVTSVANAVMSSVTVGGGDTPASFVADGNTVVNGLSPIAYTNGTIRINGDHAYQGPDNFQAHEGGLVYFKATYGGKYDLWGGTINIGYRAWSGCYTQHITAHQSDLTARLTGNTEASYYDYYTIKVEDGSKPIDFIFDGALDGGWYGATMSGQSFNLSGSGTMQTLKGWGNGYKNLNAKELTWLMDNDSGAGSGAGNLTVGENATVGGVGRFGGSKEAQVLTINGSSGKVATLAPGSLTTDGDHVFGTYTVGSETVTNTLNMSAYSRMLVRVAAEIQNSRKTTVVDALQVYGAMNVADANTTIAFEMADPEQNIKALKGGEFVIAEATDGIVGTFANVQMPDGAKWKIRYEENRIVLTVPAPGLSVIFR